MLSELGMLVSNPATPLAAQATVASLLWYRVGQAEKRLERAARTRRIEHESMLARIVKLETEVAYSAGRHS